MISQSNLYKKFIKSLIIGLLFVVIFFLIISRYEQTVFEYNTLESKVVNWLITIEWVMFVIFFKKSSSYSLKLALYLFLMAVLLQVFNILDLSKFIMGISYIGLVIGLVQLIKYQYTNGHNQVFSKPVIKSRKKAKV